MRNISILGCLIALTLVSGCSHRETVSKFDNEAFLTADSVPPLKIPAELQSTTYIEAYYPAPPGEYPEPGDPPVNPLPPNLGELLEEEVPVQAPTIDK